MEFATNIINIKVHLLNFTLSPGLFLMPLCPIFHTFISNHWSYQKIRKVKWPLQQTNDGVHSCQSLSWKRLPGRTAWIWSQLYWTVTNLPALTWKEALAVPCVCCTMLTRQPGDSLRLSLWLMGESRPRAPSGLAAFLFHTLTSLGTDGSVQRQHFIVSINYASVC